MVAIKLSLSNLFGTGATRVGTTDLTCHSFDIFSVLIRIWKNPCSFLQFVHFDSLYPPNSDSSLLFDYLNPPRSNLFINIGLAPHVLPEAVLDHDPWSV